MLDLNNLKTKLEADLVQIVSDLSTLATHNKVTDDWEAIPEASDNFGEADINVEADAVESWNERQATIFALETEYQNIKRALKKIENGNYGICEISGEPIEERRLEIMPTARTCSAHMSEESSLSL